jgi:hypothetical protein
MVAFLMNGRDSLNHNLNQDSQTVKGYLAAKASEASHKKTTAGSETATKPKAVTAAAG